MPPSRTSAILTDIQFWVPALLLVLGAAILAWVSR
jgi:hypothetical protein